MAKKESAEKAVREIRRKTRRRFSAEEKIRIVIEGLRGREKHVRKQKAGGGRERARPLAVARRTARPELESRPAA
jgi:transposase-like protein